MDRVELKNLAKQQIRGHIGVLFLITLIVAAVSALVGMIPVAGPLATALVVTPAFSIAMVTIYLKLTQHMTPDIAELFAHFNKFWAAFKVLFLTGLFSFLWSLLLVIPGIVKAYAYSMAYYIKLDHPEYTWGQCLDQSQVMMKGYKMTLFIQDLSFIGWYIVGALCFGLGTLWVMPYHHAARSVFYENLKALDSGSGDTGYTDSGNRGWYN